MDETKDNISLTVLIFMLFALLSLIFIQFKNHFDNSRRTPVEIKEVPMNKLTDMGNRQHDDSLTPASCDAHASARSLDTRWPPE